MIWLALAFMVGAITGAAVVASFAERWRRAYTPQLKRRPTALTSSWQRPRTGGYSARDNGQPKPPPPGGPGAGSPGMRRQ